VAAGSCANYCIPLALSQRAEPEFPACFRAILRSNMIAAGSVTDAKRHWNECPALLLRVRPFYSWREGMICCCNAKDAFCTRTAPP
jgi:hypothetical protein